MWPIRCPETSVTNYPSTLRNIPEDRRTRGLYKSPSPPSPAPVDFTLVEHSSISIVTAPLAGLFGGFILIKAKRPLFPRTPVPSLRPIQLSIIGYLYYLPVLRRLELEVDELRPSTTDIKSECRYIFTPSYAFLAWTEVNLPFYNREPQNISFT